MPVKSLNSSVFKWPGQAEVIEAVRRWVIEAAAQHPELMRLGYFGSCARDDWGVGSDLDLVAVVAHSDAPFEERARRWDLLSLPVPADLLVYTQAEWERMEAAGSRFARMLKEETVWVYPAAESVQPPQAG
ncbi:MAG: nucleotidyltransferase domain-containing protein [Caldilineae bacterium]|nr:MAG: nucleotidyltransferase domain-containing protein [Caldilineae bacterium]